MVFKGFSGLELKSRVFQDFQGVTNPGYVCTASSNICLSDDSAEMRLLIDAGSCLKILGGWLGCLNTPTTIGLPIRPQHIGLPIRFMFSGSKFESICRKLRLKMFFTCKYSSAVIYRPNSLKILLSSFRILSPKRADLFLIIAKPSPDKSRYFLCQTFLVV